MERVVIRQAADARAELDPRRALQRRADEDVWRGNVLPLSCEVLADPGFIEAESVKSLDLRQVSLKRDADVGPWRVNRHHEVAVPHVPIGSIPFEWTPTSLVDSAP